MASASNFFIRWTSPYGPQKCAFCNVSVILCDRAAMRLLRQEVASLETISMKEGFLGLASALLRFGHLTMHDKSLECLCHVNQGFCNPQSFFRLVTHLNMSIVLFKEKKEKILVCFCFSFLS
jgi:hypothetical protein